MIIRKAMEKDLPALLSIYNYEVLNGSATLDLTPKTIDDWKQWYAAHTDSHAILTAEENGTPIGYASLSGYREKEAYSSTVELSVYVDPEHRGKGAATALMREIIDFARKDNSIHLIVSVITSSNKVSAELHKKFGFTFCGTLHEVGYKNGAYQSINNYELLV